MTHDPDSIPYCYSLKKVYMQKQGTKVRFEVLTAANIKTAIFKSFKVSLGRVRHRTSVITVDKLLVLS
jgi:hypothetical protein